MARFLRYGTTATVKVGPFVDDADGKTAKTGLTIQKANVRLSKNGGDFDAASANQGSADVGAPYDEGGYYDLSLDATDTGTVGRLRVACAMSGALPVWEDYVVLPAVVFDALVAGTDNFDVNLTQILGTAITEAAGAGKVAAAFSKLFDVATANLVASDAMRGTDGGEVSGAAASAASGLLDAIGGADDRDLSEVYDLVASLSLGTGSKQVTIALVDDGTEPAPIGLCAILIPGVGSGYSGAATGALLFGLQPGTYDVILGAKPGYVFDNPYEIVVTEDAVQSFELEGALLTPSSAPVPEGLCRLDFYFDYSDTGQPPAAGVATVRVSRVVKRAAESEILWAPGPDTHGCDASGYAFCYAPRGFKIEVIANWPGNVNIKKVITVPDADSYLVSALKTFQAMEDPDPEPVP